MASLNTNEDTQRNTCQCGEGDKCFWNPNSSENSDKQPQSCPNCQILKSGYLFISSKGIGWTSWKKRWFILTRKSLVFYRFDPNTYKGNEANPTLGGIDLINSGSVVVKADKKLLTVNFPDGQDGRNFTLKGDTSDELQEWKTALEGALAQAPSASLDKAKSGLFLNEIVDTGDAALEQLQDKKDVNSTVIGRPVELALQDLDGSPSFLEKALRFIEEHGIKVEGVLRQSADVEEVERREKEYEQGKSEFSADEDAHIIGDCIKHVLRELPSSPVPASCCTALVEAYKADRGKRIKAICGAIAETLPEPNLRLLQRILKMMLTVASHRAENRMSLSALAACMAPLLLRPLLAGDCEFEDNFNMDGDGSVQLLKAAAAANHAQAIVIIMLEEYGRIFDEVNSQDDSFSSDMHSGSEERDGLDDDVEHSSDGSFSGSGSRSFCGSGSRSFSGSGSGSRSRSFSGTGSGSFSGSGSRSRSRSISGSGSYSGSDISIHEEEDHIPYSSSREYTDNTEVIETPTNESDAVNLVKDNNQDQEPEFIDTTLTEETSTSAIDARQNENSSFGVSPSKHVSVERKSTSSLVKSASHNITGNPAKYKNKSNRATSSMRRPTKWRRTSARKILPLEPTDLTEEEIAIQELEATKSDLEHKIAKEVKVNENLQESIQKRKEDLLDRRSALQKDVELLREQLQKERDLRRSLESGLMNMRPGHASITSNMDNKTREDLEEINQVETDIISLKQKAADLRGQISTHQQTNQQNEKTEKDASRISDNSIPHEDENSIKSDIISSLANTEDVMRESHKISSSSNKNQESEVVSSLTSGENSKHEAGHSNSSTNKKPSATDSVSKKFNSKGSIPNLDINTKFEMTNDSAYLRAHKLNSPTFGDLKPSHRLPRQPTNPSKSKLNDNYPPYIDEPITLTRNSASKKSMSSSKSEEGFPSSSSALTRLTARLNFLKERRTQIANELQNLEASSAPSSTNKF